MENNFSNNFNLHRSLVRDSWQQMLLEEDRKLKVEMLEYMQKVLYEAFYHREEDKLKKLVSAEDYKLLKELNNEPTD